MSEQAGDPALDPGMPSPVTLPERTRGRYQYTLDGVAVAGDERFVLGELAGGQIRVRSTRIRSAPTSRLEADVRYSPGSVAAQFRWTGSDPGVVVSATADYLVSGAGVAVRRRVDDLAFEQSARGILFPGQLVFAGLLVLAAHTGLEVVEPDTSHPGDAARLLAPSGGVRTSTPGAQREVTVGERVKRAVRYRVVGSAYGPEGCECTVDAGGLVLDYAWEQQGSGRWSALLVELTGPWPSPISWPLRGR